jgi:prevent-host-death family protein
MSKKPKQISATDARNNFADIVNEVYYSGQEYVITRHDEPMVKLVKVVDSSWELGNSSLELGAGSSELGVRSSEVGAGSSELGGSSLELGVRSSELGDGSLELGVRGGRQKNEPQRPKKIELDASQFKRPAGLRKPDQEKAQPDEAAATEETATEEPEKDISEEEERLARIKARILKIYRG